MNYTMFFGGLKMQLFQYLPDGKTVFLAGKEHIYKTTGLPIYHNFLFLDPNSHGTWFTHKKRTYLYNNTQLTVRAQVKHNNFLLKTIPVGKCV
jgi:hypothetical protein